MREQKVAGMREQMVAGRELNGPMCDVAVWCLLSFSRRRFDPVKPPIPALLQGTHFAAGHT